jgi:hypothetical protein
MRFSMHGFGAVPRKAHCGMTPVMRVVVFRRGAGFHIAFHALKYHPGTRA